MSSKNILGSRSTSAGSQQILSLQAAEKDMNIALLHEKADPEWKSCAKITPNLVRALVRGYAEENSRSFHPSSESALTPGKFVDELVAFHPARIHFGDHRSNRLALLKELASRRWPGGRPILVFHVYGDFVLTAREWFAAQRALTKFKVSWICASDRQASLLRKLVREKRAVKSIPFPLDTLSFYSNRALRRLTRSRLNIGDREPMLLYVGRLSEQKNIGQLLNLMSYLDALGGPLPALYLAGEFDDMGVSYLKRAHYAELE
jgi:glycosyltransferase involved in cell wall biosynthesis